MADVAPSPGRSALRDISNDATPEPSPSGSKPFCDQTTPQQASWTTGDQFKFVEEDDDEVLFRVRDSGVLRSLALPGLSKPEVVTPPNAVNANETLEQKQVCTRVIILSIGPSHSISVNSSQHVYSRLKSTCCRLECGSCACRWSVESPLRFPL